MIDLDPKQLHIYMATVNHPPTEHDSRSQRVMQFVTKNLDSQHEKLYGALMARERKSLEHYPTVLQTFNNHLALAELWQEDLDAIMYAAQLYAEAPTVVTRALLLIKINSAMATLGIIQQVESVSLALGVDVTELTP